MENEKKNIRFINFFYFSSYEKKNNNNEKQICAEPFLGYCPNYIVKKKIFILQERHCIVI